MKEPVRRVKRPWLVYVIVAAIAALYFGLLAKSKYPEPGANLLYETEAYEAVDDVPTRFSETGRIVPDVADPRALATTDDGRILVGGEKAIAVYDTSGKQVARYALDGTPSSLAVAPDGEIIVGMADHLEVLTPGGAPKAVWETPGTQTFLTSVIADDENIYTADAGHRVVYRYDRAGKLLGVIGKKDPDRDIPGLEVPSPYFDVAFDSDGALWVVNPGKLGLESYRPNGDLITSWYNASLKLEGFCGCCNPSHVTFDRDGNLITCEKGLVRVKVFEVTAGEFLELVAPSELFPKEDAVRDLAVDAGNRILVLDPRHDAIRIFEATGGGDEDQA